MTPFQYVSDALCCEDVPLEQLAREFGTPLYVYSANRLRENYRRLAAAFAPLHPLICYSVKANANQSLLRILKDEGAGFDVVSGGELFRVRRAGADPARIVFAGVGKTAHEIETALREHIGWINIESEGEAKRVSDLAARAGGRPNVAIRLRPNVQADTHHHISTGSAASKFGLPLAQALDVVRARLPQIRLRGVHVHIGSQLANPRATLQAIEAAFEFAAQADSLGAQIDTLNLGGGFPVAYREDDKLPPVESFAAPIVKRLADSGIRNFLLEPGRAIAADCAALVTEVQYEKSDGQRRIVIVDAGMHTLLRPALYEAYHRVRPVTRRGDAPTPPADIAGPICESADFLARDRALPPLASGDLLAIADVGAYGFAMASNYNSQPLPAEVLVQGGAYRLIRKRQTHAALMADEQ